jgi:hypothetical protein
MSYNDDYVDDAVQAGDYATTADKSCIRQLGACPTGPQPLLGTLFNHLGYWIALLGAALILIPLIIKKLK